MGLTKGKLEVSRTVVLISLLLMLSGCRITEQQKRQAEKSTSYTIVWHSERGNPYQDGTRIYIDPKYVEKHGLSLDHIIRHEEGHLVGLGHCASRNCVMYAVHPWFGTRNLCRKCESRLRPTTSDWIKKVLK